jgi:hypothetical protein
MKNIKYFLIAVIIAMFFYAFIYELNGIEYLKSVKGDK